MNKTQSLKQGMKTHHPNTVPQELISGLTSKSHLLLHPQCGFLKNKIDKYLNSKEKWNEDRANEIFNYYIPRRSEWDEKKQCFYFFDNGLGWYLTSAKKFLKRKDRRFWEVNCGWSGGKMRDYLVEKFQLEGFTKDVRDCADDDWTEVAFFLNTERIKDKNLSVWGA